MTDQEINEAVAKKLGWKNLRYEKVHMDGRKCLFGIAPIQMEFGEPPVMEVPFYCDSILSAWELVELMRKRFEHIEVISGLKDWSCGARDGGQWGTWESADTVPLAICKAFLKLEKE